MLNRPRSCALCGKVRVVQNPICDLCQVTWHEEINKPWISEMVNMSEELSRILRQKRLRERPLSFIEKDY